MAASMEEDGVKKMSKDFEKSNKKRKNNESVGNKSKEKNLPKKMKWSDYSVAEFKVDIKDPNTTFQAIKKFLEQANAFPSLTATDLVADYCRSSGECEEICKLLEGKRKSSETCLIFEVLECILLRLSEDLSKLKVVGQNVILRVLRSHLGLVYATLAMNNKSSHIKAALKLLTAMVIQGEAAAKELQIHLDFTHPCFLPLLNRRDIKDTQDVRTCTIQFMMSFLIVGDDASIRDLVDTRGFLNSMFPGLCGDKLSTIEVALPVLLDKVVNNTSITKTSKIRLFNDKTLKDISLLYKWVGPRRWVKVNKGSKGKSGEIEMSTASSEEQDLVKKMCHEFLVTVCCDFKHGINFFDSSYATSGKNHNHVLTNLLTSLESPHQDNLLSDLVVEILKACPDQLHWYLPSVKSSMDPRPSPKWIDCVDFIARLYNNQPDVLPVFSLTTAVSTNKLVNTALKLLIPPQEIWTCVISALHRKSQIVRHGGLRLLHKVLQRCRCTIEYCVQNKDTTVHDLSTFIPAFKEALSKVLPEFRVMTQCWNRALGRAVKGAGKQDSEELDPEEELSVDQDDLQVPKADHLLKVVQNICLYQVVLPDEMSEQPIDFPSLLEGIRDVCTDQSETSTLLQVFAMKCIAATNIKHFSWMKESVGGRSTLYLLLEMVTLMKDNEQLCDIAINLLKQLFSSTGAFSGTGEEICVWLRELCKTPESERGPVLCFLQDLFNTVLIKDPYSYTEQVAELQHDAVELKNDRAESETASVASTSEVIVDRILSMDDVDLQEEANQSETQIGDQVRKEILKLSPLLPVAIEILTFREQMKTQAGMDYVQRTALSILRTQSDGMVISLLVHNNPKTLLSTELHRISKQWLPRNMHEVLSDCPLVSMKDFKGPDLKVEEALQLCCQAAPQMLNDSDIQETLAEKVKVVPVKDCISLVKQILQYIKLSISKSKETNMITPLKLYFGFLEQLLQTMKSNSAEDDQSPELEHKEIAEIIANITPTQRIQDFFELLLSQDDIKALFLSQLDIHTKALKSPKKLSDLVTSQVARMISSVPENWMGAESVTFLRGKTVEAMRNLSKQQSSSSILTCLAAFSGHFTSHEVSTCLRYLLNLPMEDLIQEKMLTDQGGWIAKFMTILSEDKSDIFSAKCSMDIVRSLVKLIEETGCIELERVYLETLNRSSLCCLAASEELMKFCMRSLTDQSLQLARLLVMYSPVCRQWLEKWCLDSKNKKYKVKYMEKIWTVIITAATQKNGLKEFISTMKRLTGDEACNDQFYRGLWKIHDSGVNVTYATGSTDGKILSFRCRYACLDDDNMAELIQECIRFLSESISKKESPLSDKSLLSLIEILKESLKAMTKKCSIDKKLCSQMIRHLLKSHYTEPQVLVLLSLMVEKVEPLSDMTVDLYQMVMSHSQFLPTILDTTFTPLKGALVGLLIALVGINPLCCKDTHLATLFGSYQATLHHTDRKILKLLQTYENNDCKLTAYRPYLWGPKAVEHHAAMHNLGPSLTQQPSTEQVLDALNPDQLYQSCRDFPLSVKMETKVWNDLDSSHDSDNLYDPCFVLPLFNHLTASESLLNCRNFIELNCLGYVVSALSSHDAVTRGSAYVVLTSFYQHLQGSRFSEKYQVVCLMDSLRNSIQTSNQRLPSIITMFYVKALQVMLKPDSTMYQPLNEFLLLKPSIDVENVPEFYKLFNSSSEKHKTERSWMLQLMEDGLRETADYYIIEKRNTFKLLLSFFDSGLSDNVSQVQVLNVLLRACKLKTVATGLVKNHGLLSWISDVIHKGSSLGTLQNEILELLCVLWETMSKSKSGTDDSEEQPSRVPLRFTSQMASLAVSYLCNTRYYMGLEELCKYTKCVSSMLDQQSKSAASFLAAGREQIVTNIHIADVLHLVYNWSQLCDETSLKGHVKELLGESSFNKTERSFKGQGTLTGRTDNKSGLYTISECATELVKIFCHVNVNGSFIENPEVERTERVVKTLDIFLKLVHLNATKTKIIFSTAAKWVRDSLVSNAPYLLNVLMAQDNKVGKSVVHKILALYETSPVESDSCRNDWVKDKTIHQNVNDILMCMLNRCLQGSISSNWLFETLDKTQFKKVFTNNTIKNIDVFEVSTIVAEIFSQVERPTHSFVLCG